MSGTCPLCDVVRACDTGTHPLHIATLGECHVILGDNQGCVGWCVCVLRGHVEHLDELSIERQERIFGEVARVASAVRASSVRERWGGDGPGSPPRINYECLGNVVAHVHWHVVPRHANDPSPRVPVWGWNAEQLRGHLDDSTRSNVRDAIRSALAQHS